MKWNIFENYIQKLLGWIDYEPETSTNEEQQKNLDPSSFKLQRRSFFSYFFLNSVSLTKALSSLSAFFVRNTHHFLRNVTLKKKKKIFSASLFAYYKTGDQQIPQREPQKKECTIQLDWKNLFSHKVIKYRFLSFYKKFYKKFFIYLQRIKNWLNKKNQFK